MTKKKQISISTECDRDDWSITFTFDGIHVLRNWSDKDDLSFPDEGIDTWSLDIEKARKLWKNLIKKGYKRMHTISFDTETNYGEWVASSDTLKPNLGTKDFTIRWNEEK